MDGKIQHHRGGFEMSLSDKIDFNLHLCRDVIPTKDVKQFIKDLKEERESFEAQVVGMVWGLTSDTAFDVKMFNNLMVKLRKEHYDKCAKLAGEKLIEKKYVRKRFYAT